MHKRTEIRTSFQSLLQSAIAGVSVEVDRAHKVSTFPTITINSNDDPREWEEYTHTSTPSRYRVDVGIYVGTINYESVTDAYIELIEQVLSDNRKSDHWSFVVVRRILAPILEAGETPYSLTYLDIQFNYEAQS